MDAYDKWQNRSKRWNETLSEIDQMVDRGEGEYRSLTEVAGIFEEGEKGLDLDFGTVPRSDASMVQRNREAGYLI